MSEMTTFYHIDHYVLIPFNVMLPPAALGYVSLYLGVYFYVYVPVSVYVCLFLCLSVSVYTKCSSKVRETSEIHRKYLSTTHSH